MSPEIEKPSEVSPAEYIAPIGPIEEKLAIIWAELLDRERIGRHSNFMGTDPALEGSSEQVARAISRIGNTFAIKLSHKQFCKHPTVAAMASWIGKTACSERLPPVQPAAVKQGTNPLSFAQSRLWFLDQLEKQGRNTSTYNIGLGLRLEGLLQITALERAVRAVVLRHQVLATNFRQDNNQPVQDTDFVRKPFIKVVDLIGIPEEKSQAIAARELEYGFDLERDPLLRTTLLHQGEKQHFLLLTIHHIIFDGWSTAILVRELLALYSAEISNQSPKLPPLTVQYSDYSRWQRQPKMSRILEGQAQWWCHQLAGIPALHELPTDRPRPAMQSFHGAALEVLLPTAKLALIKKQIWNSKATLYMVLLAAFKLLLARYSNSEDIVVGSPIANRARIELEPLIGFFVNTLVLRSRINPDQSFNQVLAAVKQTALDAYTHQDIPFEQVVEALKPERKTSHAPIVQIVFVLQNLPMSKLQMSGLEMTLIEAEPSTAKFDLTLLVDEHPSGLRLHWEYNTDLFDRASIARMARHYLNLLVVAVTKPDRACSKIPLFGSKERQLLLAQCNQPEAQPYRAHSIQQLFEAQVERTPHAPALLYQGQETSYTELNRQANRLAHYLADRGLTQIGIAGLRSRQTVIGLLAILKLGAAYVPLDPELPEQRLAMMVADTNTELILSPATVTSKYQPLGTVLVLEHDQDWPQNEANPNSTCQLDDLAYIIYTSGSTGTPKGVAATHRGVVRLMEKPTLCQPRPGESFLEFVPLSFDVSCFELWMPLTHGARLCIYPDGPLDLEKLAAFIRQNQITVAWLTTGLFNQMVDYHLEDISGLRHLLTGGEQLSQARAQRCLAAQPERQLTNCYGPTENGILTSSHTVGPKDQAPIGVGSPLSHTSVYILNLHLEPVPIGVVGELYIGGEGLSRGYLGRARLTAEKYVPDLFANSAGARLYRSGDLIRSLPDGSLIFVGRRDRQVKIRGFRIEIGEIEHALMQHPLVAQVAVLVREDLPGGRALVAYLQTEDQKKLEGRELRAFLSQSLPAFMLPAYYRSNERLPLNRNGKIDRNALAKQPLFDIKKTDSQYAAPHGPVEQNLAAIWVEVLGRERIDRHHSFFELGGHSLLATRVISQVRDTFAIEVPLNLIFSHPTVSTMASWIDSADKSPAVPSIQPTTGQQEPTPLSYAQSRLWFLDQLGEQERASSTYNIVLALRLDGRLQQVALERAVRAVVARHQVLATNFHQANRQPVQVVDSERKLQLKVVDLEGQPETVSQTIASQEFGHGFDLELDPLMRVSLLRQHERQHLLLLTIHHIISDGWSMHILVRELVAYYRAETSGQDPKLPPLPVQYADYSRWQRQPQVSRILEIQARWWRQQLAAAPALHDLATDRPRPAQQSHRGAMLTTLLSTSTLTQLTNLAQTTKTTQFIVLLAGFKLLLAHYSNREDIVVGSPIANRTRTELEPLIGFFVNTLALRTRIPLGSSFIQILEAVKQTALDAYSHQDVPFEQVVETLKPERKLSYAPIVQILFVLQNLPISEIHLPELHISPLDASSSTAKFDITLAANEVPEGLQLGWEYNTDLFDRASVVRLARHYLHLLESVVTNPSRVCAEQPLFDANERGQLLELCNQPQAQPLTAHTIQQLFEAQVERTPQAAALIDEGQQTSYAQLNKQANRLAHHLAGRGHLGQVGIVALRSTQTVIGLLAILKLGAAYVPLDPALPAERLSMMIEDANIELILSPASTAAEFQTHRPVQELDHQQDWSQNEENPSRAGQPDELAYILYTSGTTGRPKAVAVPHRSVIRLVENPTYCELQQGESLLACAPLSFDASSFELWLTLTHGGRLCIYPNGPLDLADLAAFIRQNEIAVAWLSAGLFNQMVDQHLEDLAGLRQLLTGGEQLSLTHAQRYLAAQPGRLLTNGYGPTENTTFTTTQPVLHKDLGLGPIIGTPLEHTSVYVLSPRMEPVPIGVSGELFTGGAGLAWAYLKRPGLTAQSFVPNPFSSTAGERLYRTGDLVRSLADGRLIYLGRRDRQVKLRGYRIELSEIEHVLGQHPQVAQAAVLDRDDMPGGKALVAYLQFKDREQATSTELRAFLAEHLPSYMQPAVFCSTEALPLSSNGKLDREALARRPLNEDQQMSTNEKVTARIPMEQQLSDIWSEVLGREKLGINENFFELGGHSLLATSLITRIRARLGYDLPVRIIFEKPTIEEQASHLAGLSEDAEQEEPMALDPLGVLSASQLRLWGFYKHYGATPTYNVPQLLQINGALIITALDTALAKLIERHESLRTTFCQQEPEPPYQQVADAGPPDFRIIEMPDEQSITALLEREFFHCFLLDEEPLLRITIVRLAQDHHILCINMHHIITDGWSMAIFMRELILHYQTLASDPHAECNLLAPVPMQMPEYARRERGYLTEVKMKRQLAYWHRQLRGLPELKLPTDHAQPSKSDYQAGIVKFTLPAEQTKALRTLAAEQGATPFMVVTAAYVRMLGDYTKQDDIAIATPVAGRRRPEWEGMIGFLVGGLMLRIRLAESSSFRDLVGQVRHVALDAFANQDVHFSKVAEDFQKEQDPERQPLLQVIIGYQSRKLESFDVPQLRFTPVEMDLPVAKYDLAFAVDEVGDTLMGHLIYRKTVFKEATVQAMLDDFCKILHTHASSLSVSTD